MSNDERAQRSSEFRECLDLEKVNDCWIMRCGHLQAGNRIEIIVDDLVPSKGCEYRLVYEESGYWPFAGNQWPIVDGHRVWTFKSDGGKYRNLLLNLRRSVPSQKEFLLTFEKSCKTEVSEMKKIYLSTKTPAVPVNQIKFEFAQEGACLASTMTVFFSGSEAAGVDRVLVKTVGVKFFEELTLKVHRQEKVSRESVRNGTLEVEHVGTTGTRILHVSEPEVSAGSKRLTSNMPALGECGGTDHVKIVLEGGGGCTGGGDRP